MTLGSISNGEAGASVRSKINGMFAELYGRTQPAVTPEAHGFVGGAGAADVAAFKAAIAAAEDENRPLLLGLGDYDLSAITSGQSVTGTLRIVGSGREHTRVIGSAARKLIDLAGGGSLILEGIHFDTWLGVADLIDNSAGAAFETLMAERCRFEGIIVSPFFDPDPADGGITELWFGYNQCINCAKSSANGAGLRIDGNAIHSGFVGFNEIRGVGGASYAGQKDGISLGGLTEIDDASLVIIGNRIINVQNSDTTHIGGITVFGPHVQVAGNRISTVKSAHASNIDQYGIYAKSSYSLIEGNILRNAGGNGATIMQKGYPNDAPGGVGEQISAADHDNIIANNTLILDDRWTLATYTGISSYNSGKNIHDNTIDGYTNGIAVVASVYAENKRYLIHHNKIRNLHGTAGQTVQGITSPTPNSIAIADNELDGIGSGVEAIARGINISQAAGATSRDVKVKGNTVRNVSAATAAASRGIAVDMAADGTMTDLTIDDNTIDASGRGIHLNYGGSVDGVRIRRNDLRDCSVSSIASGGTPPGNLISADNTLDGVLI